MGQSVNPIGFRLGISRSWSVRPSFVYNSLSQGYFKVFFFFRFFDRFLNFLFLRLRSVGSTMSSFSPFRSIFYSHFRASFFFKSLYLHIFFFKPSFLARIKKAFKRTKPGGRRRLNFGPILSKLGYYFSEVLVKKRRRRRGGSKWKKSELNRPHKLDRKYLKNTLFNYGGLFKKTRATADFSFFNVPFYTVFGPFFRFIRSYILDLVYRFFSIFDIKVSFHAIKFYWFYPGLVARFITRKVKQRYSFGSIMAPIYRVFFFTKSVYNKFANLRQRLFLPLGGFGLSAGGRFNRQQMARSYKRFFRRVPFSSPTEPVDYAFFPSRLKNSAIGLKIFLNGIIFSPSLKNKTAFLYKYYSALSFLQNEGEKGS